MNFVRICRVSLSQLMLAGFVLMSPACSINTVKKVDSAPTGVVAGTLTIDGKTTSLKYVYAREHAATRVDIDRLDLRHGETLEKNVISVLLSNQSLSSQLVNDITGDSARIPSNLIGVLLTIDPSRSYHWESQFLANSERISFFGYTTTGGEAPSVEAGRVKAKLALTNQDAIHQRAFLFSFDAPLSRDWSAWEQGLLSTFDGSGCGSARLFDEYKKAMPGRWVTESWRGESGFLTGGMLTVHEQVGGAQFLGTFHFVVDEVKLVVDEEVVIDCVESKIHVRGAVVPETRWAADTLVFDLQKNRLVGTGKDEAGRSMQVVLKKIP